MRQDTSVTDFSRKTHKLEYPKKDTIRIRCKTQPQPHMPRIMPRLIKSSIYFRPIKMWLTKPLTKMVLTEAFLFVGYSGDKRKLCFLDWKEARSENEGGGKGGMGRGGDPGITFPQKLLASKGRPGRSRPSFACVCETEHVFSNVRPEAASSKDLLLNEIPISYTPAHHTAKGPNLQQYQQHFHYTRNLSVVCSHAHGERRASNSVALITHLWSV